MTTSSSTIIKDGKFRTPDSDGDTCFIGGVEYSNQTNLPIALVLHRLILINEKNAIIGAGFSEQDDIIDPKTTCPHQIESDWLKSCLLENSKSIGIHIYSKALSMQKFKLEPIELGDAAPGTYGYNSGKPIISGLNIISLTVVVGPEDDDGDIPIDVRLLIENKTSKPLPRISLNCKSTTSKGRDVDDTNIDDELDISELKYLETSFTALNSSKAKGLIITPEIIIYEISHQSETSKILQISDEIYISDETDDTNNSEFELDEDLDDSSNELVDEEDDDSHASNNQGEEHSSSEKHRIYIKTEPGGRLMFGALNHDLISKLITSIKTQSLHEDLEDLRYNNSDILHECEGVFNSGEDGEFGNEGLIEFDSTETFSIPKDSVTGIYQDGAYYIYSSLSKISIEFEFTPNDGEEFDCDKFSEVSIPVRLPECVQHQLYGEMNFNIVTHYKYNGEIIQEYDHDLCDRGYDDQITIVFVRDGNPNVVYKNYNGEEEWPNISLHENRGESVHNLSIDRTKRSPHPTSGVNTLWYGLPELISIIEGFEIGAYKLTKVQINRNNLNLFDQFNPPKNISQKLLGTIDNAQDWLNHDEIENGQIPCAQQIRSLAEWIVTGPSYAIREYSLNQLTPQAKTIRLNYSSLLDQLVDDEFKFEDNIYYLVWRSPKKYKGFRGEVVGKCDIENVRLNVFSIPKIGTLITGITYNDTELNNGEWETECYNGTDEDEWFIIIGGKNPKVMLLE